ncbi:MAG TPA: hypothetical protein DEA96_14210 [Leptospiraceae bacterium]|nr:hypothetical protein [Spirochaetaceae bacterium]HBS06117.1 hypothetical protein [Leptospiraceae bacterium]
MQTSIHQGTFMNYLIVGGNAVLGQQSILAIRKEDPEAYIISTTSSEGIVQGADETIGNVNLTDSKSIDTVIQKITRPLRAIVYVPARGPVGKPVQYANREEYQESVNFSVIPMLRLTGALSPEIALWFSGFMWLEPLMMLYGPMIYTKITMEQITLKHPDRFKCVRYGMFVSNSARGISILSQKAISSGKYPEQEDYKKGWKASGKKFKDYFASVNAAEEEAVLAPLARSSVAYRSLETEDLQIGVKKALFSETDPILNVVGDWYWEDDELPEWPPEIEAKMDLIDSDLDRYL